MNFKLDYITRILQKTSKKRIENYVISRIWHQLNNDEIKISHQQYINRGEGKYALTDLYFPQLNYHIEVNEEFHYKDEFKINTDKLREEDIINNTKGHIIRFVDCQNDKTLANINSQIDVIINEIIILINEQKRLNIFKPWTENELNPEHWIEKGIINVNDIVNLKTIDDIGLLFNIQIKNRGFLKPGAVKFNKNGYSEIWWPEKKVKNNWINEFHNEFEFITESHIEAIKAKSHLDYFLTKNSECSRIVFFKYKDELGFNFYKFVGCFKFNKDRSLQENKVVWERFATDYKI
jgi:hypothetical protein